MVSTRTLVCALCAALCVLFVDAGVSDPTAAAQLMAAQIVKHAGFFQWEYGSAIINDGMWEALGQIPGLDFESKLNSVLDNFVETPGQYGYDVLHNVSVPFAGTVGDTIGLFPIAYLARAAYYSKNASYDPTTDYAVAKAVVDRYILGFPDHLSDGTFSRANASQLWCDDQFMGTALGARLSVVLKNNNTTSSSAYLDRLAPMQAGFWKRLADSATNLEFHGYYVSTQKPSCCKWSRANGWGVMSHVEVLKALTRVDPKNPVLEQVLQIFQAHARAAKAVQSADGRWHQVLDVNTTFLETSTTGMFLLSFIEGVQNGWLSKTEFDPVIRSAWKGLASTIQDDGTVTGICEGTGIGSDIDFYQNRGTNYTSSGPGLGSVLKAALAMARYVR